MCISSFGLCCCITVQFHEGAGPLETPLRLMTVSDGEDMT